MTMKNEVEMHSLRPTLMMPMLFISALVHAEEEKPMSQELLAQALKEKGTGNLEAAAELASKVLKQDMRHADALTLRAQIRDEQRRYDEAVRDLDILLADEPKSASALYRRAVLHSARSL